MCISIYLFIYSSIQVTQRDVPSLVDFRKRHTADRLPARWVAPHNLKRNRVPPHHHTSRRRCTRHRLRPPPPLGFRCSGSELG